MRLPLKPSEPGPASRINPSSEHNRPARPAHRSHLSSHTSSIRRLLYWLFMLGTYPYTLHKTARNWQIAIISANSHLTGTNPMKSYALGLRVSSFAVLIGLAGGVLAQQDYPNKPIRYIVPYSPGGSTTWTSRLVGQRLTEAWGQQVLIDNRPGADTVIGTEAAVRSRPDGYTLVYIGSGLASNHTLIKTPYDPRKE